ncbi:regulatory protein RecX [Candidatus Marithrix sp. Canyon 246]|uniref:regulatory protein RecX n=1 Tax=Candidatus Marithrix sp. Canyon 246 TaxID=1827136 RepID=UPI00084A2168|nr:regulatory protein RecX [Candidatus Marithrix sp. Canyon 246]
MKITPSSLTQARYCAMEYLARREHASLELSNKLARKGFDADVIESVLAQLQADNLLSDERFVEAYIRHRSNKGFGPLHIRQELQKRGINGDMISVDDESWVKSACQAREKRFGKLVPKLKSEQAKQFRFLQYRGFTFSQIEAVFRG